MKTFRRVGAFALTMLMICLCLIVVAFTQDIQDEDYSDYEPVQSIEQRQGVPEVAARPNRLSVDQVRHRYESLTNRRTPAEVRDADGHASVTITTHRRLQGISRSCAALAYHRLPAEVALAHCFFANEGRIAESVDDTLGRGYRTEFASVERRGLYWRHEREAEKSVSVRAGIVVRADDRGGGYRMGKTALRTS
jgi:hypothetical protein